MADRVQGGRPASGVARPVRQGPGPTPPGRPVSCRPEISETVPSKELVP